MTAVIYLTRMKGLGILVHIFEILAFQKLICLYVPTTMRIMLAGQLTLSKRALKLTVVAPAIQDTQTSLS
ncbi:hypothetical protein RC54_12015 [Herbaspirillum rubrisubalbicans]|uniref:Uncharacterized protein n=1 Tax=Herbaspirillum rubrisubalbicans TaxID=80842 RepID=A0AAD0U744_9BURK|nr:hypothetical protein RC54_12015 [Herbaspirillum rubrisubalbicans]